MNKLVGVVLAACVCLPTLSYATGSNGQYRPYNDLIEKYAEKNGVPVKLAHAIITVESNYKAGAYGQSGEIGLMQIKPTTARGLGYKGSAKGLYNPEVNIAYGMKYLGKAYELGGKTPCGAVFKYIAGHYAKKMGAGTRKYCARVEALMK